MMQKVLFWSISVILTLFLATYQRVTGPTYPVNGSFNLDGKTIKYELPRSSDGAEHTYIRINLNDPSCSGKVTWKRFKTQDNYSIINMELKDGQLQAELPRQPAAGKLEYTVQITKEGKTISVPDMSPVIIRFRDPIPIYILMPHIFMIFLAMLIATRTGLEYFNKNPRLKFYTILTIVIFFIGGFILGPLVQYFAFGAFWTGFPFGIDLTDNKTLIVMITWLIVFFRLNKSKNPKRLVLHAAIIMFLIYLIPHSIMGSELDYKKSDAAKGIAVQEQPVQK